MPLFHLTSALRLPLVVTQKTAPLPSPAIVCFSLTSDWSTMSSPPGAIRAFMEGPGSMGAHVVEHERGRLLMGPHERL